MLENKKQQSIVASSAGILVLLLRSLAKVAIVTFITEIHIIISLRFLLRRRGRYDWRRNEWVCFDLTDLFKFIHTQLVAFGLVDLYLSI